ncbi:DNA translocase FtsK 4TM domain-containing protein [Candidatus Marinimicrobia bacterium]|nr:DNA translocase FtsK 4TM domain-containing protein [Candidatus Neomarinimicrobiota bacterium]
MPKKTSNKNDKRHEILGVLILAVSTFIVVSLIGHDSSEELVISPDAQINNPMGILGVLVSHLLIKLGFGYVALAIPILGVYWGWVFFSKKDKNQPLKLSSYGLLAMLLLSINVGVFSIYLSLGPSKFYYSGFFSGMLANFFLDMLSIYGCTIFIIAGYIMLVRAYFDLDLYKPILILKEKMLLTWNGFLENRELIAKENEKRNHTNELKSKINLVDDLNNKSIIEQSVDVLERISTEKPPTEKPPTEKPPTEQHSTEEHSTEEHSTEEHPTEEHPIEEEEIAQKQAEDLNIEEMAENAEVDIDDIEDRKKPKRKYILPSSDLLMDPVNISDSLSRDELVERANYLTQSLSTYGVEGKVVNVHPGPVITLFEVEPAEGVRVNKFVQLSDDLARVMEASSVRVIAPIPGRSSVGIEIPNRNPATVYFKSVVNSPEFAESESMLTLAIGKTTSGEIATLDLGKMPHLLIAGTTGSGKSVCINTIICSILYHASPDEVKFVMIDPKKVEMTLYKKLEGYHLLKMADIDEPIVTSVDNAILSLRALEKEMDRRYNVLAEAVVRNISEYNDKMKKSDQPIMPYIVLVIDELADLMMLSAKDVEAPIARLAQLARAVGIHLVIATQRPSVDVITGVIKANFPSRIAFQVASKIDSRTIIDQQGADKLIGRGDMLHLGTGSSDVFRMHNAFLTLEEIEAIMGHVIEQPKSESDILPSVRESLHNEYGGGDEGSNDELFNDAIALVVTHQQGSISLLQRRLKVGYSRAARLIDEMEQSGIVGPFTGSKAREVLVDESYLEIIKD